MSKTTPSRSDIVEILNRIVKDHRGGLDFAAYAIVDPAQRSLDNAVSSHRLTVIARSQDDLLDERLDHFACNRRATEQCQIWTELLHKIDNLLCLLDQDFIHAGQGANVRVLFDVDMGGFYYTRLTSHTVVFGATINQAEVNNGRCEMDMHWIVSQIQALFTVYGA